MLNLDAQAALLPARAAPQGHEVIDMRGSRPSRSMRAYSTTLRCCRLCTEVITCTFTGVSVMPTVVPLLAGEDSAPGQSGGSSTLIRVQTSGSGAQFPT